MNLSNQSEPWHNLLADASPKDHIVQLYQDPEFLNRAVCRFAAATLDRGEGLILVPTAAHWKAFRPRLESAGVNIEAAQARGQLRIVDAEEFLPRFMQGNMPDSPLFLGMAGEVIAQARQEERYKKVRWWGEMVNVLWEQGNVAASMALEDLFDQLGQEKGISIFCSFLMDNFNGEVHTRMLPRLGQNHSHLIPVEDYARLERAVAYALREALGPGDAGVVEKKLLGKFVAQMEMPRSQALLLALHEMLPLVAENVLKRTRALYAEPGEIG